jgi:oligopeptide transport system substrate-binding protein
MKKLSTLLLVFLFALVLVACGAKTFTVTFNSNGGSAVAAQTVEEGKAVIQPASPTRSGYVFDEWYSDSALTAVYSFGTPVSEDITLYAGWTEIAADEFVVSFNTDGGNYIAPVIVKDGETVAQPAAPVKANHTFKGWSLNGAAYNFATPITGNITLIALWQLQGVTDKATTYYTYISEVRNMNPYSETLADSSTMYSLVSDAPYEGDYDFVAAREKLVADGIENLPATIGFEEWYAAGYTAADLPFNYFPAMAADLPVDVNGDGTVWEVTLKANLQFVDGTPINAETFNYSYQQLLSPDLLNARATNLYETDSLPLVNGKAYFDQNNPKKDSYGFMIYIVDGVEFSRDNSYYGQTTGGYDIYHVESKYEGLVGPEGEKAYVENWGGSYGLNGWVLETEEDDYFLIGSDDNLYAPYEGWTLDGEEVPVKTDLPTGVTLTGYFGAYPAYMDADGNRAVVGEDGIPTNGVTVALDPVDWEDVGFEVVDELTFRFHLTMKKSQWQVMTQLSSAILSVVHPENFEAGKIEDGTRTTYGTIDNPLVAFGVYELIEWVPGSFYIFERNDAHYGAEDYDIQFIRYDVISDQSVAVAEFIKGNLDIAAVSGDYYQTYKNSDYLKLTPVTTFFRFAFSLDRAKDGDPSNDTPIMQDPNFRLALYFATDRETFVTDVRAPGYPTQSILGPLYYSSEQNPYSYRASVPGTEVVADLSPDTFGFDPVRAKELFDEAYANALAEGLYAEGEKVEIEFVFFDAESNHKMAEWLETTWEGIFGSNFDLVRTPVDSDTLDQIWDNGNFDLTFGGWQGMQFWAPGMLQVYSSGWGSAYILEVGFDTGNAELTVELPYGKAAVTQWIEDLEALETLTETQEDYLAAFEEFLLGFEGDVYTTTYDELGRDIYYKVLDYDLYEGRDLDFDNITAAMEGELMRQMINIPLFTSVGATIYSSRVEFDADSFHARMGWGGLKYMQFKAA